jgi:glutamate synthase domain-containing protein 1
MKQPPSLYTKTLEKDSCGVGLLAHLHKRPSRKVVVQANEMLVRMSHRGGCGRDPASGDGAGMLVGLPHAFLCRLVDEGAFGAKATLTPERYAIGNVFFRKDDDTALIDESKMKFNALAEQLNLSVVGWRHVPTSNAELGVTSKASEPLIEQVLVLPRADMSTTDFERELYR